MTKTITIALEATDTRTLWIEPIVTIGAAGDAEAGPAQTDEGLGALS